MTTVNCKKRCKHNKNGVCALEEITLMTVGVVFQGETLSCWEAENEND